MDREFNTESLEKMKNMSVKQQPPENWWQKLVGLFKREKDMPVFDDIGLDRCAASDPILQLDELQTLVSEIRSKIDMNENEQWDLNLLAASTYLYHIERILVKVRENLLTIRYRSDQFKDQSDFLQSQEFIQVKEAEEHCNKAVLNLTALLKRTNIKKVYDDEVVTRIHALELESANLNMAVRCLNQWTFRHETLQQLAVLEQTLNQSLLTSSPDYLYTHHTGVIYSSTEMLRKEMELIQEEADAKWLTTFVDVHDMLKKCYVVARKSVIKDLLDKMGDHIHHLIKAAQQQALDQEVSFRELSAIFNNLESIRFNCHRESRCSKNLFDKAKLARQQLRKACQQHSIGCEYLRSSTIKRQPLRNKLKSSL